MAKENQSLPRSFLHLLQSVKTSNDPIMAHRRRKPSDGLRLHQNLDRRIAYGEGKHQRPSTPSARLRGVCLPRRRVGYTTDDWQAGARHLQSDIQQHMGKTREFFGMTSGRLYAHKRKTPTLALSYRKFFYNSLDWDIMSHTRGRCRS